MFDSLVSEHDDVVEEAPAAGRALAGGLPEEAGRVDDGAEEDGDDGQVEALVVRETGEVVDDDPHVGPVQSHHDGDVVQPLPGGPGGVTGHGVEQGAGHHTGLAG